MHSHLYLLCVNPKMCKRKSKWLGITRSECCVLVGKSYFKVLIPLLQYSVIIARVLMKWSRCGKAEVGRNNAQSSFYALPLR